MTGTFSHFMQSPPNVMVSMKKKEGSEKVQVYSRNKVKELGRFNSAKLSEEGEEVELKKWKHSTAESGQRSRSNSRPMARKEENMQNKKESLDDASKIHDESLAMSGILGGTKKFNINIGKFVPSIGTNGVNSAITSPSHTKAGTRDMRGMKPEKK